MWQLVITEKTKIALEIIFREENLFKREFENLKSYD